MGTLLRLSWTLPWLLPAVAAALEKPRPPVSGAGRADPHLFVLQICVCLAAVALLITVYAIINYRRGHRSGARVGAGVRTGNASWALVPAVVLLINLSFVGDASSMRAMLGAVAAERPIEVKVTGRQGVWEYEYLGRGVRFESRTGAGCVCDAVPPLVLPAGREVRILGTSGDVPHAFDLPALGLHNDVIPGYVSEARTIPVREGTYRGGCGGECRELRVPVVVEVVSGAAFDAWLVSARQEVNGGGAP